MPRHATRTPTGPLKTVLGLAALASALTGLAISGPDAVADATSPAAGAAPPGPTSAPQPPNDEARYVAAVLTDRAVVIERRARLRARAHRASRSHQRRSLAGLAPREIGRRLAGREGWSGEQWTCLDDLWTRESRWQVHDTNSGSGAYGIPQSLPADKMAWAGSDWRDNAVTQIRWGLHYIADRYGDPCSAWAHSQSYGYY